MICKKIMKAKNIARAHRARQKATHVKIGKAPKFRRIQDDMRDTRLH